MRERDSAVDMCIDALLIIKLKFHGLRPSITTVLLSRLPGHSVQTAAHTQVDDKRPIVAKPEQSDFIV